MPLLLTDNDVANVLTMHDTIRAVEEGFRQVQRGTVKMPQRTVIHLDDDNGVHLGMPAYAGADGGVLAFKVVTVFPDNPSKHDTPTILGTLLLNDPRTGALLAIMDARHLTAMRTGASSGVATKYLAREDARSIGVFGAGIQARTQLMAVHEVRSLDEVKVFDPLTEARKAFAHEMSEMLGLDVTAVSDPRECAECEIICTATKSETPVFDSSWLRPGTHVNAIGSHTPDKRELDTQTILGSKFVTDDRAACLEEAGDLIIPIQEGVYREEEIHADLGEVINGVKTARESDGELTVFKSVGVAIQDAMTARRVYELARVEGLGTEVGL